MFIYLCVYLFAYPYNIKHVLWDYNVMNALSSFLINKVL